MDIEDVVDDILEHHGIKGMKWGHRKDVHPDIADVPKKTRKEAAKDAEEHTRAQMFFGEGAGIRRRLIKAKVETRKKKDPLYAKAFDHFVKQTNLDKRASQARKERRRKDVTKSVKRNAKIISRIVSPAVTTSLQSSHTQMLKDRGRVTPTFRHSDILREGTIAVEDILEHHGIKGMHWGVRSSNSGTGTSKAQAKLQKGLDKRKTMAMFHNTVIPAMNNHHFPRINHEFAKEIHAGKLHPKTGDPAVRTRYHEAIMKAYIGEMNKHAEFLTDKTGTQKVTAVAVPGANPVEGKGFQFKLVASERIQHASETLYTVRLVTDENGIVTGIELVDDSMEQSGLSFVQEVLEHHGVKGMHWGVRKSTSAAAQTIRTRRAQARSPQVTVRDRGKKLKTSGGKGLPAHPDAIRVREIGQRGKGSGLKTLSDQELRTYAARLQLEQNVHRLNYNEKNAGGRFVSGLLKSQGSRAAKAASGQAATAAGRSALNAATRRSIRIARIAAVAAA